MQQPRRLGVLAARQHDPLGVFANVNKSGTEARLLVQLVVIELDERACEQQRDV